MMGELFLKDIVRITVNLNFIVTHMIILLIGAAQLREYPISVVR